MISGSNLNISTANFKSNLAPADKTAKTNLANEQTQAPKSKEEIQKELQQYSNKTIIEIVKEAIDIDESNENWITKTIDKIDGILSKKYTAEELRYIGQKDPESKEDIIDANLQTYMWMLMSNSRDGKPTIWGKILGFGTKQEQEELKAFRDSLGKSAANSAEGSRLMDRADISIEEFKRLYAQDVEKTMKARKEMNEQMRKELEEYNANLAKQNREAKFKPIQATSKSKTYVDKDIRREFFENFLKAEQEKGTDITEILSHLVKIGKFDVRA
nr:cell surface protein [uncultured Campylobacter sp.]